MIEQSWFPVTSSPYPPTAGSAVHHFFISFQAFDDLDSQPRQMFTLMFYDNISNLTMLLNV